MNPTKKPAQKKVLKEESLISRFVKGNVVIILAIVIIAGVIGYVFIKKEDSTGRVSTMSPAKKKQMESSSSSSAAVPSRRVAKKPSSKQEKSNVVNEEVTPDFVKEHVAVLNARMDSQIRGGELTLSHVSDPKQRAEIQRRIDAAKRFKEKLAQVNAYDSSTWFWEKDKPQEDATGNFNNDFQATQ